jgi:hypothetical protein
MIEDQAPERKAKVEQAIVRGANDYRQDDGTVLLRWPAMLTVAERV